MPVNKKLSIAFCLNALLLASAASAHAQSDTTFTGTKQDAPYRFGVHIIVPEAAAERKSRPILDYLGNGLQHPIRFNADLSHARFRENIRLGAYDIIFVDPFEYVKVALENDYIPVAKSKTNKETVIVTREALNLASLTELKGMRIGLPAKDSPESYLVKLSLFDAGLVPGKDLHVQYYESHDSCLEHVLSGDIDACGSNTYQTTQFISGTDIRFNRLNIGYEIPAPLYAVHQSIPLETRIRLGELFRELDFAKIYEDVGIVVPNMVYTSASAEDYEVVRDYWVRIREHGLD